LVVLREMVCGEGRRERRTDQKAQCPCCCQIADGEAWKTARLRHALSLIDRVTHRVDSSGRRRIGRCYVATFIRISLANGTPPIAGRVESSSTAVSTKQKAMSLRQTFTSRRQYSPEGRRFRTITASLAKAVGVGRWRHGGPLVTGKCPTPAGDDARLVAHTVAVGLHRVADGRLSTPSRHSPSTRWC